MYLTFLQEYKKRRILCSFLIRWKKFDTHIQILERKIKFLGYISTSSSSQETARNIWKRTIEKLLRIL